MFGKIIHFTHVCSRSVSFINGKSLLNFILVNPFLKKVIILSSLNYHSVSLIKFMTFLSIVFANLFSSIPFTLKFSFLFLPFLFSYLKITFPSFSNFILSIPLFLTLSSFYILLFSSSLIKIQNYLHHAIFD